MAKRAFNRLAHDLQGSNPRSRIEELYEQSGLDSLGAGAALLDRAGTVLWESPNRSPGMARKGAQQQVLNEGTLHYAMPEKQPADNLKQLAFAISGLGIIVYGVGAWLLVGATLKPISRLVGRVTEAKGDPSLSIVPPSTDHEIVSLVATLNNLIQDVRKEGEERINSYATLSHELRTPIHSLLLKLDLALGSEQCKAELEATLVDVQRQVYRLKNLSEAVLTLQGLSQSPSKTPRELLNIRAVLDDLVVDLQALMELRALTLDLQVADDLHVLVRREHLVLLLRNLLENAVKHSLAGSVISVHSAQTEAGAELRFTNSSSGNTQLAGNGLGLRICREIVRANGWQFEAAEQAGAFCAHVKLGKVGYY